jgi:hypothetical protein
VSLSPTRSHLTQKVPPLQATAGVSNNAATI